MLFMTSTTTWPLVRAKEARSHSSHGLLMIIDVSRVPVIYSHDSIDITKDFIAEYNRTHPAAAAAPAKP